MKMSDSQEKKYGIKILSHSFVYLLEHFDISTFTCNMRWKIENCNRKPRFHGNREELIFLTFTVIPETFIA